jgi:hypothetical protein
VAVQLIERHIERFLKVVVMVDLEVHSKNM